MTLDHCSPGQNNINDNSINSNTVCPSGTVSLQTVAMPKDTNWNGDVFGGWLVSQMDIAGAVCARLHSKGRTVTVAIDKMVFHHPVEVGDILCCYTTLLKVGYSSMQIKIEVWKIDDDGPDNIKVTEGMFTYVAIDDEHNKRLVPSLN